MSFGGYLMPGLAENSVFVSSCLFWCLFSMCIPYCWGLGHLSHCLCPRNENAVVQIRPNIKQAFVSVRLFSCRLQEGVLVEAWIFLERAEKWEDEEEDSCFSRLMSATVVPSCLGADMLPALPSAAVSQVQWWAACCCCFKEKTCWRYLVKCSSVCWNSGVRILSWNLWVRKVNRGISAFLQRWHMDLNTRHIFKVMCLILGGFKRR